MTHMITLNNFPELLTINQGYPLMTGTLLQWKKLTADWDNVTV